MLKCPYCYEPLKTETDRCPHCAQYLIDDAVSSEFPSLDKKPCIFCGEKILQEAKFCRYCHKWIDEVDQAVNDIDPDDLV